MSVDYEWKWEYLCYYEDDPEPDIEDVDHRDSLTGLKLSDVVPNREQRVCLVRNVGNEDDGLTDRQHAYVTPEGKLPERFDGGKPVPQKFHQELAKLRT